MEGFDIWCDPLAYVFKSVFYSRSFALPKICPYIPLNANINPKIVKSKLNY